MEKEREKIKEPFDPEKTPKPPQQIDPDMNQKRENPLSEKGRPSKSDDKPAGKSEGGHLLDEEADINDETTV